MESKTIVRISALIIFAIDIAAMLYAILVTKKTQIVTVFMIIGVVGCIALVFSNKMLSMEEETYASEGKKRSSFKYLLAMIAFYLLAIFPFILFLIH